MIKAVMNLDAPRPHVFAILTDYPNYRLWIPGCQHCNVISKSGHSADTEIVISSMKRIEMGLRFEANPVQSLNFRMTKGKGVKAYSGTYRLMDSTDGRGTVVVAELEIDAGMMVPKFMVDGMVRKMMDDTGVALKKHLHSAPIPTALIAEPGRAAAREARPRRARRILRVTKTAAGYRVWLLGETFSVKSQGA